MEASKVIDTKDYTKYEKARVIGARSLQIGMGAPFLVKLSEKQLEEVNYNPINIAKLEFAANVIPINIVRHMPTVKKEEKS